MLGSLGKLLQAVVATAGKDRHIFILLCIFWLRAYSSTSLLKIDFGGFGGSVPRCFLFVVWGLLVACLGSLASPHLPSNECRGPLGPNINRDLYSA